MVSRRGVAFVVVFVLSAVGVAAKDPRHARLLVHAHVLAAVATRRGRLRLVAVDGIMVDEGMVAERDNGGEQRPLGEDEAERELIAALTDLHRRLDPAAVLAGDLSVLLARLEHRQARRARRSHL